MRNSFHFYLTLRKGIRDQYSRLELLRTIFRLTNVANCCLLCLKRVSTLFPFLSESEENLC